MTPRHPDACRVYRDNHGREQTRLDGLVDGEEYFVVLVTPDDPDSFVGISSIIRWTRPAPQSPSPIIVEYLGTAPKSGERANQEVGHF